MASADLTPSLRRVAIIQARTSSSRLPGKVLADLGGLPMIIFMAKRVQEAKNIDRLLVATSTDPSDDPLEATLQAHDVECYRGSLTDVLDRFYNAAAHANADIAIRLTGDCPLIEPHLIDRCIVKIESECLDYVSNCEPATYPDGLDVEAIRMNVLFQTWKNARLASEREHVTPYIRNKQNGFRLGNIESKINLSSLRWTVDHIEDLEYVRALFAATKSRTPTEFDRFDLLRIIEQHEVNRTVQFTRNEGYATSLATDYIVHP